MKANSATVLITLVFLGSCSNARLGETDIPTTNPTAISDATLAEMYYGSEPVSDGILSLEIENTDRTCFPLKSRLSIKFTFSNLSNEQVTFPIFEQNDIGFKPILTSRFAYIYYDPEVVRDYMPPTVKNLVTLSSNEVYEGIYKYSLPIYLWIYQSNGDIQVSTPSPGEYLLKFVFENYMDYDAYAWKGRIASNQIEICVTE